MRIADVASPEWESLPRLPAWVTSGRADTAETVAFRSGAALLVLDRLVSDPDHSVPVPLLANKLALSAAAATSRIEGRLAREGDIRDALHLTPPGAARGPDGDLLAFWRDGAKARATGRRRSGIEALARPEIAPEVQAWLRDGATHARSHGPLAGCAQVLAAVLASNPRAERIACLLSDVALAQALGWRAVLPLTVQHLDGKLLRSLSAPAAGQRTNQPEITVQGRILAAIEDAIGQARDLARRAAALRAVAPKLRARGSDAAVELFLAEDAVAPSSMLSPLIRGTATPMTSRAARRFCDRLVELGVARELTGRATFRLYGL